MQACTYASVLVYASMLELCTVQSKGQIVCMFDLRHFPLDASIYHYPSLAVCQARMLSGRYRTCWLERHWCATNPPGNCSLPTCSLTPTPGTLSHILTKCKDLEPARERVLSLWAAAAQDNPTIQPILTQYSTTTDTALFVQFLLDCTVLPEVIVQSQIEGKKFQAIFLYLTRTFCFSVHKSRLTLLGKWNVVY